MEKSDNPSYSDKIDEFIRSLESPDIFMILRQLLSRGGNRYSFWASRVFGNVQILREIRKGNRKYANTIITHSDIKNVIKKNIFLAEPIDKSRAVVVLKRLSSKVYDQDLERLNEILTKVENDRLTKRDIGHVTYKKIFDHADLYKTLDNYLKRPEKIPNASHQLWKQELKLFIAAFDINLDQLNLFIKIKKWTPWLVSLVALIPFSFFLFFLYPTRTSPEESVQNKYQKDLRPNIDWTELFTPESPAKKRNNIGIDSFLMETDTVLFNKAWLTNDNQTFIGSGLVQVNLKLINLSNNSKMVPDLVFIEPSRKMTISSDSLLLFVSSQLDKNPIQINLSCNSLAIQEWRIVDESRKNMLEPQTAILAKFLVTIQGCHEVSLPFKLGFRIQNYNSGHNHIYYSEEYQLTSKGDDLLRTKIRIDL